MTLQNTMFETVWYSSDISASAANGFDHGEVPTGKAVSMFRWLRSSMIKDMNLHIDGHNLLHLDRPSEIEFGVNFWLELMHDDSYPWLRYRIIMCQACTWDLILGDEFAKEDEKAELWNLMMRSLFTGFFCPIISSNPPATSSKYLRVTDRVSETSLYNLHY